MPTFEVQHPDGRTFEVQAPNMQAASEALTGALSDSDLMAALNRSKAPSEMSDAELMSALKPPPGFVLDQPSTAASTGLAKFRQQYPQYNDMSDSKLADSLYNRFYSDMPRAEFDAKLGLKSGGMFDDLIPSRNAGMFDDLIPKQTAASTALDVAKQLGAGAVIALENVAAAPAKLSGLTGELVDYLYPPDPEAARNKRACAI